MEGGVSNFTVEQIKQYQNIESSLSPRCRIYAVQNQYDILAGENPQQAGVLAYAAKSNYAFVAWSPLARGLLTSRYLNANGVGPGDRLFDEKTLQKDLSPEKRQKVQKLAAVAMEAGLELAQMVLAYMPTLPGMGPLIPAVSSVHQLEVNAKAAAISLDADVIAKIKNITA